MRRAQTLVTAAAAAGVGHLVVVTSAMAYGALPDNPVPLPEDAPAAGEPDEGLVGDLLAVEQVLAAGPRRSTRACAVTVVRPAALVGPGIDTVITRHFEAPRLLTVEELHAGLAVLPRRGPGLAPSSPSSSRASGRSSRSRPRAR